MVALSRDLLILFSVLTTAVFLWRFIRDKSMANIDFKALGPSLKVLLALVIPVVGLLLSASAVGLTMATAAPYFAGAAVIVYILSRINVPPFLRGLALLGAAVAFTTLVPEESYKLATAGAIAGLLSWKGVDNLLSDEPSTMEDVLPPFLWLTAMYWTKTVDPSSWFGLHQNLVLAAFTVVVFMRWIQDPFLKEDKLYVKRICLALTGGLVLLILITKMLVAMSLAQIAVIGGAGFFLAYLLQAMDKACENDSAAVKCFKQLLFIGIFTLLATRLFYTPGLLVLAISTLIATRSGAAHIAGLYWGSYVLMQAFMFDYNSNMTGINIMHPYTSAALYAGLLIGVTGSLLLKQKMDNRSRALIFIAASLLAPAATNFFLHAEPTSSLMVATLIGSVLMAIFSPAFGGEAPDGEGAKGRENVMLIPASLISVGIITGELIEKGNSADSQQRMIALAVVAVVATIVLAIASYLPKGTAAKPAEEQPAEAA